MNRLMLFASDVLDQLPPEVIERLPDDVVQQLEDGTLDKIPEDVVDKLPVDLVDKVPDGLIDFAAANPMLTAILAVIGVLAAVGFFYGIVKSAIKVAVSSGVLSAVAWYFFFQQ